MSENEVDVPQLNLLLERASKDVKSINELKNIAVKLQLYELGAKCREIELTFKQTKMRDKIVEQVIEKYRSRSEVGIVKYGTTLENNFKDDFLLHLQEELFDASLYIEKLRSIDDLYDNVLNWANEKGILEKATPMSQALKTLEEVNELLVAINNNDLDEIKDAFGDIFVTIIIGAKLSGLNIIECLASAYDVIKDRKGSMVNGTFVKEA